MGFDVAGLAARKGLAAGKGPAWMAFRISWRAVLVGGLTTLAIHLAVATQLYATIFFLVAGAAVVAVDMGMIIKRAAAGHGNVELAHVALTHSARAEREKQLEFLQTLLDTVAAALIVVDADGRITLANRAALNLAGMPVTRLHEIRVLGEAAARDLRALPSGTRKILRLADGQRVFVSVSRFTASGGRPQRLIALQRIAGELDSVELEAWQEMARVLAHEMMNSLTPISSLAESLRGLLQRPENAASGPGALRNADVSSALEIISRRSLGLMDFVERYRAVAELPPPRRQRVEMAAFLRGIQGLLDPELAARAITCHTVIDPDGADVLADAQLLEQAVINLLRNAADAVAGAPDPVIKLSCSRRQEWLAIEIADNGSGVSEDIREQVFVPFFSTKPGGSGIGLNLTRQIALSHGGQLELRPNEPRGSVFTLLLPAQPETC